MKDDFTIFFTFFADGDVRRKYIEIALKTLFVKNLKDIPIVAIDASSRSYTKKNKDLFLKFSNLTYINDQEVNPFKRCEKYLHYIKTPFILRLLEDCAYINLGKDNFSFIRKDILLMERNKDINVIQYPIIDDQQFILKANTVFYPPSNFEGKTLMSDSDYVYYDRSQERKIYHYLCNNLLYRTDFFIKHWRYVASKYDNHSSAESGDISNSLYQSLLKIKYVSSIARLIYRLTEKVIFRNCIIGNIFITQTMLDADVIHIGYYSTEVNSQSNFVREIDSTDKKGTVSVLKNLKVFNDIELLNNIHFQSDKSLNNK